jgi:ubiquinone/menaquinone biosynthesis C-methylase UbiE
MFPIRRGGSAYSLVAGMTGARMGDSVAQIGCAHGGRLAAIASPVGLSGRVVAIVPDDEAAARARKGAADGGVLVDVEVAPPTRLPVENDGFDLAVIDDTGGMLSSMREDDRGDAVREALRILRPGGRVMVIGALPRGGLGALFGRAATEPSLDPASALQAAGFKSVRTLAEREGLRFTEGIRSRS